MGIKIDLRPISQTLLNPNSALSSHRIARTGTLKLGSAKGKAEKGSLVRIGPHHAKGFDKLIGLNANFRQGFSLERFELDLELSCGFAVFSNQSRRVSLHIKNCYVNLALDNCSIVAGTRYEHVLSAGSYTEASSESSKANSNIGAGVDASIGASAAGGLGAKITGFFKFGQTQSKENSSIVKADHRVELIATSGQDRWRVGDEEKGDARQPDGLLSGSYFSERGSKGDPAPLCVISADNDVRRLQIRVTASVPMTSLVVRENQLKSEADSGLKKQFNKRSKQVMSDHEAELRARVSGLSVAKAIKKRQSDSGILSDGDEILMSVQTIIYESERND
ncbi:hypothetical protein [Bosea beijingensis]|jgi:hypothetical protein